jgi:hypothetical protein
MSKHTQAHLSRTVKKNLHPALVQRKKEQMEYYMGAKLIEIGVEPKAAIYRWSLETKDDEATWTYSAFWGESKDKLLSGKEPLAGAELIDCARANASQGLETAAKLCGYAEDLSRFQEALHEASAHMGLKIESLNDLKDLTGRKGIEVVPDTSSSL